MKRIIVHWTAGTYNVSELDRSHYHFVIDGSGKVVDGKWRPEANEVIRGRNYAAHTRGCNTGSIGVSLACMAGAVEHPFKPGKYPLKELQWDKLVTLVAFLARTYKIPVTPQTILSHAEVEKTLGIKQAQKWDIARLPFDLKVVGAKAVGDKLRREVSALLNNVPKPQKPPVQPVSVPKPPVAPQPVSPPPAAPAPSLWARFKALFSKGAK